MSTADSHNDPYYQAVTAIDAGDVERLQLLLAAHPRLVSDRLDGTPEWLRQLHCANIQLGPDRVADPPLAERHAVGPT